MEKNEFMTTKFIFNRFYTGLFGPVVARSTADVEVPASNPFESFDFQTLSKGNSSS